MSFLPAVVTDLIGIIRGAGEIAHEVAQSSFQGSCRSGRDNVDVHDDAGRHGRSEGAALARLGGQRREQRESPGASTISDVAPVTTCLFPTSMGIGPLVR
jgi:hypothetical protein